MILHDGDETITLITVAPLTIQTLILFDPDAFQGCAEEDATMLLCSVYGSQVRSISVVRVCEHLEHNAINLESVVSCVGSIVFQDSTPQRLEVRLRHIAHSPIRSPLG